MAWGARYSDDPVGFAADVLGVATLWEKQTELLRLAVANRLTTALSANTVGKSFTLAVLVLWWLYCRGPSAALVLTPGDDQNRVFWRTVRDLWLSARVALPGELRQQGIELGPKHYARGRVTTGISRLTGEHHERLLVVLDEAQGFGRSPSGDMSWVWEASYALAGGAQNKIVAAGNPGPRSGPWYDRCQSPAWAHVAVSALEHPNVVERREVIPGAVSWQAIEDVARDYGRDSGVFRIRVLGAFADDAVTALIRREWVDAAIARWHAGALAVEANGKELLIGLDVARSDGGDRTVLLRTRGGHVEEIAVTRLADLSLAADWVRDRLRGWNVRHDGMDAAARPGRAATITVDANGVGAGVHDALGATGWPVSEFFSQGAAEDARRFWNRRAEAGWRLRERFQEGRIAIPPDPDPVAELLAQQYALRPDGRLILDDKGALRSRLGRSPDLYDALAMALYEGDGWSDAERAELVAVSF